MLASWPQQVKALQVRLEEFRALAQQRMEMEAELKSLAESTAAEGGVAGLAGACRCHRIRAIAFIALLQGHQNLSLWGVAFIALLQGHQKLSLGCWVYCLVTRSSKALCGRLAGVVGLQGVC